MPDVSPLVLDMVVGVHLNMVKCFKASYLAHRKMPQACFFFVSAYFGQFHRPVSFSMYVLFKGKACLSKSKVSFFAHWHGKPLAPMTIVGDDDVPRVVLAAKIAVLYVKLRKPLWRGNDEHERCVTWRGYPT
ncbi:hypothetical protein Tco_0055155, partial [Tanacetum coccineum]